MRPLKKIKMNRFLKVLCLLFFVAMVTACKDDDSTKVAPPRDYGVQYITEKADIENYLKSHYISGVDDEFNINFAALPLDGTQTSIWDQTEYPLQNKIVNSNSVDYTVYYLMLNQGTGGSPSRYDNIRAAYRGTTLPEGTQFDYMPFPQGYSSLTGAIEGWQEIIPLFQQGTYIDNGGPDPARFENYGAGAMFLPSGLAYYNTIPEGTSLGTYVSMIFTFKLYQFEFADNDADGILTKDETVPGTDPADYDTDGDGIANYLDTDDDNDGVPTLTEIKNPAGGNYSFDEIPVCPGGTVKRHLDVTCH